MSKFFFYKTALFFQHAVFTIENQIFALNWALYSHETFAKQTLQTADARRIVWKTRKEQKPGAVEIFRLRRRSVPYF